MDTGEESSTCAICFDSFLCPKILSCRHTFCKPCLEDYTKKVEVDEIVCPLCRQKQILDCRGLDGLMDNYFVPLRAPELPVILCCDICYEEAEVNQCSHCILKLCYSCKSSHNLALKMSGEKAGSDLDSEASEGSDLSEDGGMISIRSLVQSDHSSRTKLIADFVSAFKVPCNTLNDQPSISCIFPKSEETCLVIVDLGPEIIECTLNGRPFTSKCFSEGIRGITKSLDNKILFSNVHEAAIFQMVDETRIKIFAKCYEFRPSSLSAFKDGRIVSVGSENNFHHIAKRSEHHGALQIYDTDGKLLREIVKDGRELLFKHPVSVSVNPKNDTICTADAKLNQVLVMTEEGYVIRKYKGTNTGSDDGHFGIRLSIGIFIPTALCHDEEGNLVIANVIDGSLHILLPNGDFCGFIATRNNRNFGNPNSLCFDSKNRLWVGDHRNGKVKIFEILSFRNNLIGCEH
ncbi:uncharacterized protein LOC134259987 [Saccostrea cucullata]|uniref:uncharacterized protein LOC134259987 n=1 Tax=Saccostrea cuccullata TaxID=36930 RepID=UPI002ED0BE64